MSSGHAHAAERFFDHRNCSFDRHLELEQVGDDAAVALLAHEAGQRHAVGVDERATVGTVEIGHEGHAGHSRRRPRS